MFFLILQIYCKNVILSDVHIHVYTVYEFMETHNLAPEITLGLTTIFFIFSKVTFNQFQSEVN